MVFLVSSYASSAENIDQACRISRAQDVIACVLSRHPDLVRAQDAFKQALELKSLAGQIPNPELDSNVNRGKLLGDTVLESEVSLGFTIELGGKRGARIKKAKAEESVSKSKLLSEKEKVVVKTVVALFRLKHIFKELSVIEEALSTFDKIQKQYRARVKLNAEQQVSLEVFQLAQSDYQFQKRTLFQEKKVLKEYFLIATGLQIEEISKILPQMSSEWSDLNSTKNKVVGSELKLAQSRVLSAQGDLSLAQSQSWPDLKVGPMFRYNSEGGISYPAYGLTFSVPLPLFSLNSGGRAYASRGLLNAERSLGLQRSESLTRKSRLYSIYKSSVEALRESPAIRKIEGKHKSIEKLFFRGLISSPLVIEAHRQIIDVIKSQNDQEIRAAESLWEIYALEGRILQEELR